MKRSSNRLVLLVGIFLAVVAFILIAVMMNGAGGGGGGPNGTPAVKVNVVVAAKDLPLGSKITSDAVTTKEIDAGSKPADSYADVALVIGQVARQPLTSGQLITSGILNGGGQIQNITVPAGYVGIAVQVDQVTGVGTLIKPGDRVDVVTGFGGLDKLPLVVKNGAGGQFGAPTPSPRTSQAPAGDAEFHPVTLPYNPASVKVVVEGLQVLGTLLPPPSQQQAAPSGQPQSGASTSLNGQQEIVILAASVQQAEAVRYAQVDGTIALVLRSAADCQNADGTATQCPIIPTSGITLRKMVDDFGVLPPQVVEILEPSPYPSPMPVRQYPSPTPVPSGSAAPSTAP